MDLQLDSSVPCKGTIGEYRICRSVLELDGLINIPVLKGHCQTAMTCALKNMKGCIPNSEKQRYHREGLFQPIADLNEILRPDLILVDALQGDLNFEEGGNPFTLNFFMAALDPVLLDGYACFSSLTQALKQMQEERLPLPEKVCIGQGFKKKTLDGPGVGDCLSGCASFVPGCPPEPYEIVNYLKNQ